ncbi:unnamed protein product [Didymodactylos carnosus]|uniref:CBM1 domain-containing protein n=1 Tax=Didymodactylos carnosus TaxID=1234261 RepID=A0A8S2GFY8_9BILA|nr:unnamed protein product [Didymodactylos carnosus]CAF3510868.1 unnamed protein product [Didymodactylos carnosus]
MGIPLIVVFSALIGQIASVAIYQQCGGEGYSGPTACDFGLQCYRKSYWYSSCQTSCPKTWECETYIEREDDDNDTAKAWDQCGGQGFDGLSLCPFGFQCVARSIWYSQCRTDCPTGWSCMDPVDSTTPIAVTVPTTPFIIEEPTTGLFTIEEMTTTGFVTGNTLGKIVKRAISPRTSCTVSGQSGVCKDTKTCGGTTHAGYCPGASNIQCCIEGSSSGNGLCGSYVDSTVSSIKGNNDVTYQVVKIKKEHLSNQASYSLAADQSDNTMTTSTACAFDKMVSAAAAAGVKITIASGFRTIARQNYFWNCYQTKLCNNGNLAAKPGSSNHGKGIALDLNTDCGKQTGSKPSCDGSAVYQWLYNNGHKYGFTRTVQSEPWHWEFRGIGVQPASFS